MDWDEYPRHEENQQLIDAGAKLIAGIVGLTAIVVAVAILLT